MQPVRITEWCEVCEKDEVSMRRCFKIEAYMKKHPTDGRVYFAVDDEVICDRRCRTERDSAYD